LSKLVFPSEKTGGVISGWTEAVAALQRASGVVFTLHDLRRTCRTLMSHHRVDFDIAELAIGHKRTGLARLYDFAELWEARCDAFAKASEQVGRLAATAHDPGKVVPMPGRAP
jgi:integrase